MLIGRSCYAHALDSARPALTNEPGQQVGVLAPGQLGQSDGTASSSGQQPALPALCDGEVGNAAGGSVLPVGQPGQRRPQRLTVNKQSIVLEGATVTFEKHGLRGHPGAYERLRVRCPLHSNCEAQRSFSARLAEQSGLPVDLEPYAFIGLWLSRRHDSEFPGQHGQQVPHNKWKPDPGSVALYAWKNWWV